MHKPAALQKKKNVLRIFYKFLQFWRLKRTYFETGTQKSYVESKAVILL